MAYFQIARNVRTSIASWPVLAAKALSKTFGRVPAISNVSFTIGKGEIVGLIGPARSGKSVVVDLLAGAMKPTFGRIAIAGEDVTQLGPDCRSRHGIARGMQPSHLLPDFTVLENFLLGGAVSHTPFFSRRGGGSYLDEAMVMLELAGLADASNSRVVELAPFKQRILTVAIALAAKPSLLLLDGPAVGMSEAERFQLAALLANGRNDSMSVLITAHNMVSLSEICDRILVLKAGKILDDAPSRIERKAAPFDGHLTRSR